MKVFQTVFTLVTEDDQNFENLEQFLMHIIKTCKENNLFEDRENTWNEKFSDDDKKDYNKLDLMIHGDEILGRAKNFAAYMNSKGVSFINYNSVHSFEYLEEPKI